jgi:putative two-component system response regulator
MDGFAVLEMLQTKHVWGTVPVIMTSICKNESEETRALLLGAEDYIYKPFSRPILLKRIQTYISMNCSSEERTRQFNNIQNCLLAVVAEMVDGRDNATGEHTLRTQKYFEILLEAMSRENRFSREIARWDLSVCVPSAKLHDIGKICIPDAILTKPGSLTPDEKKIMQSHAIEGVKLIDKMIDDIGRDQSRFLKYASIFAGTHHEKYDGSGYPYGLSGDVIPLQGRMMAIVDVYDALTSKRVYKDAISQDESVDIIKNDSGTAFDPDIVKVFLSVADDFGKVRK